MQMSAVSERFACLSWSAAERADRPLHPSRWRQSYGSNGWLPHRSQAWPMAATSAGPPTSPSPAATGSAARCRPTTAHLIKHTACRDAMSECRSRNDADSVQRCPHHKFEGETEALEVGGSRRGRGSWIGRAQAGPARPQPLTPMPRALRQSIPKRGVVTALMKEPAGQWW